MLILMRGVTFDDYGGSVSEPTVDLEAFSMLTLVN